ncbi:MAG: hypothetical protein QY329_12530 [Anaerolineales bacterium]|nr:MAG: hypothetical protein QY329_12530 [Anaerolineales bacterium]
MQKNKVLQQINVILIILLSACGNKNSPDVVLTELSANVISYDDIVRINNCGGKADSEQIQSRSFATTFEGGIGLSAGYQAIVEGNISAKYNQYKNITKSQKLIAPPGTNMEFVLRWSEEVRAGNVRIDGSLANYEVRIPISVEQISSRDLGNCTENSAVPTQPILIAPTTVAPVQSIDPNNSLTDKWACIQQADKARRSTWEICWRYIQIDNAGNITGTSKENANAIEWIGPTDLTYTTIGLYHSDFISEWYSWALQKKPVRFCIDINSKAQVEGRTENILAGCYLWQRGPFMIEIP